MLSQALKIYSFAALFALAACSKDGESPKAEASEPIKEVPADAADVTDNELLAETDHLFAFADQTHMQLAQETFGRYVGVMKHAKIGSDQLAKLDFIVSHENGIELHLKAVLSLYFGDFTSKEYVSYHFDRVSFNLLTSTLVFQQSDQDLSFKSVAFKDGKFVAEVFSGIAGKVGTLDLQINGTSRPTRPLVDKVWGEYQGMCGEVPSQLQLRTFRTTENTSRVGNPFGTYHIRGQVADNATFECGPEQASCVADIILEGSYDYLHGRLNLLGKRQRYDCQVSEASLDCGVCQFSKAPISTTANTLLTPLMSRNTQLSAEAPKAGPVSIFTSTTGVEGEYTGYLHHERLNQYQAARIDIMTYQETGDDGQVFTMAADARLYFGEMGSAEVVTYKFEPRPFDLQNRLFVFERVADDVDAVLQIVSLSDGTIKGVWHSIQFGRVGTFELRKKLSPAEAAGSNIVAVPTESLIPSIAGVYRSNAVDLYLDTRLDATPSGSSNPFFPNDFGGFYTVPAGISSRINITGGSYDFYTGRIGLETDIDGHVLVGDRDLQSRNLWLKKPATDLMRVPQAFAPDLYVVSFEPLVP